MMAILYRPQWIKAKGRQNYRHCAYCVGMILGLRSANERRSYFVTTSLIGWVQAQNQLWCECPSVNAPLTEQKGRVGGTRRGYGGDWYEGALLSDSFVPGAGNMAYVSRPRTYNWSMKFFS